MTLDKSDLFCVWKKNYDFHLPKSKFNLRSQSTDPLIATRALTRFANFIGGGRKLKAKLTRAERFSSEVFLHKVSR